MADDRRPFGPDERPEIRIEEFPGEPEPNPEGDGGAWYSEPIFWIGAILLVLLLIVWTTCSVDTPPTQQKTPVTTEPSSMEGVFRGQASVMVVYQGKRAGYSVGPNRQADFSPENRSLLDTSEEKRGFNKVRTYSFKDGVVAPDSTLVAVCEYPATIKTAICTW